MTGAGTSTSPYTLSDDDGDSEIEVMEAIYPGSRCNSMTPPPSRLLSTGLTDSAEDAHIDENHASHSSETARQEIGQKRKRSESVVSMDCQSDDSGGDDGPSTSAVAQGNSVHVPGQSRKAKKRRIKAQAKKEQYLDRLRRLQHNPLLVPPLPLPQGHLGGGVSPFAFLPGLNNQLLAPITFPPSQPQDYPFPGEQAMPQSMWSMGGFSVQPSTFNEQSAWSGPLQVPDFSPHPPVMAPTMGLDPSSASGQSEFYAPPKFSMKYPDAIGVKQEDDPAGKHGLFEISKTTVDKDNKPYAPDPDRTLVLEQLPKLNRSKEWITQWSLSVCHASPVKTLVDGKGKALIEFPSREQAEKAWASPRLGSANLGLKQHLLKGRPRDDLIRAHWYRVDDKSAGGGEEIEEGEIEEGKASVGQQGKKDKNVKPRAPKRLKLEEDLRVPKPQPAMVPQKPRAGQFMPSNGLPPRPSLPQPPPPRYPPAPLPAFVPANGVASYRPIPVNENDDMDISPPSTASMLTDSMGPKIPSAPRAMMGMGRQKPQLPPKVDAAPPRTGSLPSVVNTTPRPVGTDSTAREADLRKRVLETKRMGHMLSTPLPQLPPPPQLVETSPNVPSGVQLAGVSSSEMSMDVDSFLAGVPRPPPISQVKSDKGVPSAREQEKAALSAREEALARELAALRENKRLRQTEQKRYSPALTGPGSQPEFIKPSPKLGLGINPDLVRRAPWLHQIEQAPVVICSDDEDDDEDYVVDRRDPMRA